jgi:hypothetical protein
MNRFRPTNTLPGAKDIDDGLERATEPPEKAERLLRERSIKTNRRQKFIKCLSNLDINLSMENFLQNALCSLVARRRATEDCLGGHSS